MRRLVLLVSATVFVDTVFYAVVAPLLPGLVHQLHLSKLSAGVLTASYPLGTLLGALPGGALAARAGPRITLIAGLSLMAVSSVAFGFADSVPALDGARFVQGVGGACSWAGGLTWLVDAAGPRGRGGVIGAALGAGIAGSVLGPAVGTIAHALGRRAVFASVLVVAAVLIAEAGRVERALPRPTQGLRDVLAALRAPGVLTGMWLMGVPAVASGMLTVLGPLRLGALGAGATAIGATFLVATALEATLSPIVGRFSDRRGRMLPLRAGLASAAMLLLCFTLPGSALLLAALIVLITGALGTFWAPAMAMLSDAADQAGLNQGFAFALLNLAWAAGQVLGGGGGGALAKAAGEFAPAAVAAALCALTLATTVAAGAGGARRETMS
jgi:MFS family permease